jgi:hypothetical protein
MKPSGSTPRSTFAGHLVGRRGDEEVLGERVDVAQTPLERARREDRRAPAAAYARSTAAAAADHPTRGTLGVDLSCIVRPAHDRRPPDPASRLLDHVSQLMSEQLLTAGRRRAVLAWREVNVAADGEGPRRQGWRDVAAVDAHGAQVGAEHPFHVCAEARFDGRSLARLDSGRQLTIDPTPSDPTLRSVRLARRITLVGTARTETSTRFSWSAPSCIAPSHAHAHSRVLLNDGRGPGRDSQIRDLELVQRHRDPSPAVSASTTVLWPGCG